MYFVSRRSLKLSRKTEFGASGHCRISTSDSGNCSRVAAFQNGGIIIPRTVLTLGLIFFFPDGRALTAATRG